MAKRDEPLYCVVCGAQIRWAPRKMYCDACRAEHMRRYQRAYRQVPAHRSRRRAYMRAYYREYYRKYMRKEKRHEKEDWQAPFE